ncbi:hypothetical protein M885DRAFT_614135 [Pelagophyceae sp. CCMP2097]|nr:hypothetical protein M885DRAFT_614135 [Pelagophyceae sp. CCMP2097]
MSNPTMSHPLSDAMNRMNIDVVQGAQKDADRQGPGRSGKGAGQSRGRARRRPQDTHGRGGGPHESQQPHPKHHNRHHQSKRQIIFDGQQWSDPAQRHARHRPQSGQRQDQKTVTFIPIPKCPVFIAPRLDGTEPPPCNDFTICLTPAKLQRSRSPTPKSARQTPGSIAKMRRSLDEIYQSSNHLLAEHAAASSLQRCRNASTAGVTL